MRKQEFFKQKFKLQEQVGAERRKGNDVTELQEALDGMKTTPDFVALSLGASAMIKRMDEEWTDEDGKIVRGPTEEEVAELPATAYDLAFCFSLIMLYWAWITIIKHLVQLLRTTRVDGRGWYLTTDLQIDVNTPLYNSWLIVMTAFLLAYLIAIPYSLFQSFCGGERSFALAVHSESSRISLSRFATRILLVGVRGYGGAKTCTGGKYFSSS